MSATEIVRLTGIPRSTLYRLVAEGKIPARNITKPWHSRHHWEFDPEEVRAALDRLKP